MGDETGRRAAVREIREAIHTLERTGRETDPRMRRLREALGDILARPHRARCRASGATISWGRADAFGMDGSDGPWAAVCEDHGSIAHFDTATLARSHAAVPEWCAECLLVMDARTLQARGGPPRPAPVRAWMSDDLRDNRDTYVDDEVNVLLLAQQAALHFGLLVKNPEGSDQIPMWIVRLAEEVVEEWLDY